MAFQRGQAIVRLKPRGFRSAFAARHEAVPTAQEAVPGDEPFAGRKVSPVVGLHDMHQCKAGGEFRRTFAHVFSEAVGHGGRGIRSCPEPPFGLAIGTAQQGLRIAAQCGGQSAFISGLGGNPVQRSGQAVAALLLSFARLAVTLQRLPFTLYPGQFGLGGGKGGGGLVARGSKRILAGAGGFQSARAGG